MKLVVVESPLAGDFMRNRRYALWCAYDCYMKGEAAYASHLIYTQFLDDENPGHREFGIAAGLAWAAKADFRAFYVDLGMSPGMQRAWESMADDVTVTKRKLPKMMLDAFEVGRTPSTTPAF